MHALIVFVLRYIAAGAMFGNIAMVAEVAVREGVV